MIGFYIAIGKQGSGKTAMITKLCTDNHITGVKIFSNYTLFKIPFIPVVLDFLPDKDYSKETISILETLNKQPDFFNGSIMLLDEIHLYFDSLDFMKKNSRKCQKFFSQIRKRNILLLATTQYIMNVDIRIRRQALNVFEMDHIYKDLFNVTTHEIDGYFTREISSYNVVLSDYYDSFDTNEIINE